MSIQPIDASVEDYEVLSFHSSDNELIDDALSYRTRHSTLSEGLADSLSDNDNDEDEEDENDQRTGDNSSEFSLKGRGNSSGANRRDDSFMEHSGSTVIGEGRGPVPAASNVDSPSSTINFIQSIWSFPGCQLANRDVLAPLNEGIEDDADLDQLNPALALKQTLKQPAKEATEENSDWHDVMLPESNHDKKVRYILMSGSYRSQFQPIIRKVNERFPNLHLIWIDTATREVFWITDSPQDIRPDVYLVEKHKHIQRHAVRFDFYSTKSDHKPSSHKYIDENIFPGYSHLGFVPICPQNASLAYEIPTSVYAPFEVDAYGSSRAITDSKSFQYIRKTHLAAVLASGNKGSVRSMRTKQLASILPTVREQAKPLLWLVGSLAVVMLYSQLMAFFGYDEPVKDFLSAFVGAGLGSCRAPFKTAVSTPPPSFTGTATDAVKEIVNWSPRSDFNIRNHMHVPSSIVAPTLEQIEEILRTISIYIHKLGVQAKDISSTGVEWVKSHANEYWESSPAMRHARDKITDSVSEVFEEKVLPLWSLGRSHAAGWTR